MKPTYEDLQQQLAALDAINRQLNERVAAQAEELAAARQQSEALAAENEAIKHSKPSLKAMLAALDAFYTDDDVPESAMLMAFNILRGNIETPATVAAIAEFRAQGVEMFEQQMHADITNTDALEFAQQLRAEASK